MKENNKIGWLVGKIVEWSNGTGEVIIHCTDDIGREVVRLSPLTGEQFPTDFLVKDIKVVEQYRSINFERKVGVI